MLLPPKRFFLSTFVLLGIVVCTYAAPTVCTNHTPSSSITPYTTNILVNDAAQNTSEVSQTCNSNASFRVDLWKPSVILPKTISQRTTHTKTLPALPGAVFMVLLGAGCIVFFRERRTLATVLAGIFLLSQYGIKTLPKLSARLSPSKLFSHISAQDDSSSYQTVESNHPAGRSDSIPFIGLLHRLAGSSDCDGSFNYEQGGINLSNWFGRQNFYVSKKENVRTHLLSAPISLQSQTAILRPTRISLKERSISFSVFSPAFIFDILSRGPPLYNLINYFMF